MDFLCNGVQQNVNGTGGVLPVPNSHKINSVGIHWLRISFTKKHLENLVKFCDYLWSKSQADGFGLWSYDSRYYWQSGVSLNYDCDDERCLAVHAGMITLDCPGGSLDELSANDLFLLIEVCNSMNGKCSRIDVYFDDYKKIVMPRDLHKLIEKGDYSGFRKASRRDTWQGGKCIRDEVSFGARGSFGNGKYLRFYDKFLESNGEQNCCRWEVEFTHKKADVVFKKFSQATDSLDSFANLCGALIAGCVTFVHRSHEKNISRLDRYEWWERILEILGEGLSIRIRRTKDSVTGKIDWIKKNVAPSLACLRHIFISDRDMFRWLWDVCSDGEPRMNPYTRQLAIENQNSFRYSWGELTKEELNNYELSKL